MSGLHAMRASATADSWLLAPCGLVAGRRDLILMMGTVPAGEIHQIKRNANASRRLL